MANEPLWLATCVPSWFREARIPNSMLPQQEDDHTTTTKQRVRDEHDPVDKGILLDPQTHKHAFTKARKIADNASWDMKRFAVGWGTMDGPSRHSKNDKIPHLRLGTPQETIFNVAIRKACVSKSYRWVALGTLTQNSFCANKKQTHWWDPFNPQEARHACKTGFLLSKTTARPINFHKGMREIRGWVRWGGVPHQNSWKETRGKASGAFQAAHSASMSRTGDCNGHFSISRQY